MENNYKNYNFSQRALVMQGGAALGAYEAGVFSAIYDHLTEDYLKTEKVDRHLFDILAGTSIGAIHAAIIVHNVVKNRKKGKSKYESWRGVVQIINNFWQDLSTLTFVELDPTFPFRWNSFGYLNDKIASTESARRYYSVKELLVNGSKNMFDLPEVIPDKKFLDPMNTHYLYDNGPLRKLLEDKYLRDFSLKTEPPEPRLLLVTVDVQEGTTVTFDSYSEKTEYNKHVIEHLNGLTIDHVLASASVPIYYDFTTIAARDSQRKFWDGIILSNTPLRELIGEHNIFWKERINKYGNDMIFNSIWNDNLDNKNEHSNNIPKVPDIDEIYIVNLWPKKEELIPTDHDGQIDRKNDIIYHDKTEYDEKVAIFVTDYIDLVKRVRQIALKYLDFNKGNEFRNELDRYLKTNKAKSKFRNGDNRMYVDLLNGRFNINNIIRIERQDDKYAILNKWADFSYKTINKFIFDGYMQGKNQLVKDINL